MTDFEREDLELAAVMGGRFHDETQEHGAEPATMPGHKPEPVKPVKNTPVKEKPCEAPLELVKPFPDFMDKLKATTKDVSLYAVLSVILFWWQQAGLLEETTAWYALLVCVGMVFFSVGKNCRGGK